MEEEINDLMAISMSEVEEFEETDDDGPPQLHFQRINDGEYNEEEDEMSQEKRPEEYADDVFLRKNPEGRQGKGPRAKRKKQPPGGFNAVECTVDKCKMVSTMRRRMKVQDPDTGIKKFRNRPYFFYPLPSDAESLNKWIEFAVSSEGERKKWKEQAVNCQALGISLDNCPFRICERHFEKGEPTAPPVYKLPVPGRGRKTNELADDSFQKTEETVPTPPSLAPQNRVDAKMPGFEYLGTWKQAFKCLVRTCPIRSRYRNPADDGKPYRFFRIPFKVSDRTAIFNAMKAADPAFVVPNPRVAGHICERHFDFDAGKAQRVISADGFFPTLNLDPESNQDLDPTDLDCSPKKLSEKKKIIGSKLILKAAPNETCHCTIRSCNTVNGATKNGREGLKLYRMPGHGEMRQLWYENIKGADAGWEATRWSTFVCELHFENGDTTKPPTLYLEAPFEGDKAEEEETPSLVRKSLDGDVPQQRRLQQMRNFLVTKKKASISVQQKPLKRLAIRPQEMLFRKPWCCNTIKPIHATLARVEGKINCIFGMIKTMMVAGSEEHGSVEEQEEINEKIDATSSTKIDSIFNTLTQQISNPAGTVPTKATAPITAMKVSQAGKLSFVPSASSPSPMFRYMKPSVVQSPMELHKQDNSNVIRMASRMDYMDPRKIYARSEDGPVVHQTPEQKLKNLSRFFSKQPSAEQTRAEPPKYHVKLLRSSEVEPKIKSEDELPLLEHHSSAASSPGLSEATKRLMTYKPGPKSVKKRRLEMLKEALHQSDSEKQSATVEITGLKDVSDMFSAKHVDLDHTGLARNWDDSNIATDMEMTIGRGVLMLRGKSLTGEYLRENGRVCFSGLPAAEIEEMLFKLAEEGALQPSIGSQLNIPVGHQLFHKLPYEQLPASVIAKYNVDKSAYTQEFNAGKGNLRGIRMGPRAVASSTVTNQLLLYQKMMDRKLLEAEEEAQTSGNDVVESNFDM